MEKEASPRLIPGAPMMYDTPKKSDMLADAPTKMLTLTAACPAVYTSP